MATENERPRQFRESIEQVKGVREATPLRRPEVGEYAIVCHAEKMPTLVGKLVQFVERPVAFPQAEDEEITAGHISVWCRIPGVGGVEYLFRMSNLTYNDSNPDSRPPAATEDT